MNWIFCWLPLAELLGAAAGVVGDAEARQPLPRASGSLGARNAWREARKTSWSRTSMRG